MKTLLLILIIGLVTACNGDNSKTETETEICDNGEIIAEDGTCVNSTFYSNLTDKEITQNGGTVELKK